ncbi:uncharacterized protein LOC135161076 [Diachasmimorpha longicaudata]|uniref:uncharacterized protein LOC135161076 n=1 Tax=Diachasmimorpha longicaudata TaxID=58733 RepID=UPI0030B885CF
MLNIANCMLDEDENLDELLKQIDDSDETDGSYQVQLPTTKAKRQKLMAPNLTAVLDRAKVSDRMAARILAATLIEAGITLEDVDLSRETIRRNRQQHREVLQRSICDNVRIKKPDVLGVHWDGKQETDPGNKFVKADRLSVLVSGHEWSQLLGVPRLERGTGYTQAEAVHRLLKEWDLLDDVCTMVFDTTASNTGAFNGACILLEQLVGRDLLHLPCRHHILELLLRAAFESGMGWTSGPDVPIFKRFQVQWSSIDKNDFSPGVHDATVKEALNDHMQQMLDFAEAQLKGDTVRMDYKEFLELVVLFLGGNLPRGNRFRALIGIHHARWMSKSIYSLKIFLFRNQFNLTSKEKSGLIDACIFIIMSYQRAWFTASNAVSAPNNDLHLLKRIATNASSSSRVAVKLWKAVFAKFVNHLWYLSEELIAFAFFDENVTLDCKRKMCRAIKSSPPLGDDRKRRRTGIHDLALIPQLSLDSFVTQNTQKFFEILRIDCNFLESDPVTWEMREDFAKAIKIVKSLQVTNDIAERSVALMSEYNNLLTRDENSKQNLLLIVKEFRELSPGYSRKDLQSRLDDYLDNQLLNVNK